VGRAGAAPPGGRSPRHVPGHVRAGDRPIEFRLPVGPHATSVSPVLTGVDLPLKTPPIELYGPCARRRKSRRAPPCSRISRRFARRSGIDESFSWSCAGLGTTRNFDDCGNRYRAGRLHVTTQQALSIPHAKISILASPGDVLPVASSSKSFERRPPPPPQVLGELPEGAEPKEYPDAEYELVRPF
jgi:hypothetical protein